MSEPTDRSRLSGEDLSFWWVDSPMQPTTMAMLMVLEQAPQERLLRNAFERAIAAVPRLTQRVVDAPLDLTLPHWESDPTFDLDYHLRRHALAGPADVNEVFHEIGPAYETPFDRSRPLWEARLYEGLGPERRAALFFKLHHAVADGVGGNAIFAAMTDWTREPADPPPIPRHPDRGPWSEKSMGTRLLQALRDRVELDVQRARSVANALVDTARHPENLSQLAVMARSLSETFRFDSGSPLKGGTGRARRLRGIDLPFAEVRGIKHALRGSMIDVILTIMARAIGRWYRAHGITSVHELMTLVPVNLRRPQDWTENVATGNVATGILVPLPIRMRGALSTYREIHARMEAKKNDPASRAAPVVAEMLSVFPRPVMNWLAEATFGSVDFIVTNVPGILVPRYLAGVEILAAYPFAPVAMHSPVSIALYGYRDRLFIGIDADCTSMPDVDIFESAIQTSFAELQHAALRGSGTTKSRRPRRDSR